MATHNVERDFGSYDRMVEEFRFTDLYEKMDWDAPDRLNVAHETCDRHAGGSNVAMEHVDETGTHRRHTFQDLALESNRFANLLDDLGVERGDRVFTYLPRIFEHYITLLGTIKAGGVFGAINERYGEDGIAYRLRDSGARVLVTTADNLDALSPALAGADGLETVLVIGTGESRPADHERLHSYEAAIDGRSADFEAADTGADDNCLLYYTSGTTGRPKGVVLTHSWLLMAGTLARYVADLTGDDLYWSTADMGWLTGPLHTLGPWFWGHAVFVDEAGFEVRRWVEHLADYGISVLHTVPTVLRSFREDEATVREYVDGIDVRHATSVGEPLEPAVVEWVRETLDVQVHDTYGQTECGGVVVTNMPGVAVKPGSMGKPMPGADVDVIDPETAEPVEPGETGEIAWLDSPAYFTGYWQREGLKAESMVDGWYRSGDLAHRDADGYVWFEGRADDVILSSGYRIGPFEVERAIAANPGVAEAAVVPKPDERRGNIVLAFVRPTAGTEPTEGLKEEITAEVRETLSKHAYPREIRFVEEMPKTVTGKIRRTELNERVS